MLVIVGTDGALLVLQETISLLSSMYIKELPMLHSDVDITWYGRHGVGLALRASADVLTPKDPAVVITFLISRALVCELC